MWECCISRNQASKPSLWWSSPLLCVMNKQDFIEKSFTDIIENGDFPIRILPILELIDNLLQNHSTLNCLWIQMVRRSQRETFKWWAKIRELSECHHNKDLLKVIKTRLKYHTVANHHKSKSWNWKVLLTLLTDSLIRPASSRVGFSTRILLISISFELLYDQGRTTS